jgi:hypothetical protein
MQQMAKAALAAWFRGVDREKLKHGIDNPEDVLEWAKEQIRMQGRRGAELMPLPPPDPEPVHQAHRIAAATYQRRNIAEGKCRSCPKPLARICVVLRGASPQTEGRGSHFHTEGSAATGPSWPYKTVAPLGRMPLASSRKFYVYRSRLILEIPRHLSGGE